MTSTMQAANESPDQTSTMNKNPSLHSSQSTAMTELSMSFTSQVLKSTPLGTPLQRYKDRRRSRDRKYNNSFPLLSGSSHHHKIKPKRRVQDNNKNNSSAPNLNYGAPRNTDDDTTLDDDLSLSSFGADLDDDSDDDASNAYDADNSLAFHFSFASYGESLETDFLVEQGWPVKISVRKSPTSPDTGLVFKTIQTVSNGQPSTWIYVDSISKDSVFENTSLRQGDKIICINNINLRENPDLQAAYKACSDSKESIAMVVLKDDDESL